MNNCVCFKSVHCLKVLALNLLALGTSNRRVEFEMAEAWKGVFIMRGRVFTLYLNFVFCILLHFADVCRGTHLSCIY